MNEIKYVTVTVTRIETYDNGIRCGWQCPGLVAGSGFRCTLFPTRRGSRVLHAKDFNDTPNRCKQCHDAQKERATP